MWFRANLASELLPTVTIAVYFEDDSYNGTEVTIGNETKTVVNNYAIVSEIYTTADYTVLYDGGSRVVTVTPDNIEKGDIIKVVVEKETKVYKIMTVQIDMSNSDPSTCCSYADDAIGMEKGSSEWDDFFGHYPCLLLDGVENGIIDRNDFTKLEDGTVADVTSGESGDVMICFPRRGIRISSDGDIVTVSMTDNPHDANFKYYAHQRLDIEKDAFYIGAYSASLFNDKLRSLYNVEISNTVNLFNSRTYASNNGDGYSQWGYNQLSFIRAMYLLKYANLNSQATIGNGRMGVSSTYNITGSSFDYGMDSENIRSEITTKYTYFVKLFGIENLWGNKWQYIDGVYSNTDGKVYVSLDNNFENEDTYTASYTIASKDAYYNASYIKKITANTEFPFCIEEGGGSETTYFCDNSSLTYYDDSKRYITVGGSYTDGSACGIFKNGGTLGTTSGKNDCARLMYL